MSPAAIEDRHDADDHFDPHGVCLCECAMCYADEPNGSCICDECHVRACGMHEDQPAN